MNQISLQQQLGLSHMQGIRENIDLSPFTWFRVGGKTPLFFRPKSEQDLEELLKANHSSGLNLPIFPLGVGSNLLIRDGGLDSLVIKLSSSFAQISLLDNGDIQAGAAALMANVAFCAMDNARAGLEFLSGIPGTVGGGLRMNAGAYGNNHASCLRKVIAYTPQGKRMELSVEDMSYGYRSCGIPEDWLFTSCIYHTTAGDKDVISTRITEIKESREQSQPIKSRTGGSTFANPPGHSAWELIDAVGLRGAKIGDAQISEKHCNFLVNCEHATAQDIESLGELARTKVKEKFNIDLRWEVKRIGKPTESKEGEVE